MKKILFLMLFLVLASLANATEVAKQDTLYFEAYEASYTHNDEWHQDKPCTNLFVVFYENTLVFMNLNLDEDGFPLNVIHSKAIDSYTGENDEFHKYVYELEGGGHYVFNYSKTSKDIYIAIKLEEEAEPFYLKVHMM